ncbi:MAG: CHAD domain-containing protein [Deferribacterales bacterium]
MTDTYLILKERPETSGGCIFNYSYEGSEEMTVMDSYDYLLMGKGFCLCAKDSGGVLLFGPGGDKEYADMDDAELTAKVQGIIKPRVLLEKHKLTVGRYGVVMLDDLEKTIAKGSVYAFQTDGGEVWAMNLEPLRGYDKDVSKGVSKLNAEDGTFGDVVKEVIKASGDELITYSAKPVLSLEPDMPVYEVMGGIYSHLLYVMEKNTEGIINDVDIEFLHDFRVSVRRMRSAMSIVRGVFDKAVEKEFRARFRVLGSLTGLARDMDVYMERLDDYERMLPQWLKGGMSELAAHFTKTREAEYKKLGDYLSGGEFKKLAKDWRKVIKSKKTATEKGKRPVLPVAKKAIWQAFEEIEKQAEGMNTETHSDEVHQIRISFKKIRYLLEFYSSLFDKEKTAPMLKDMKVLQDSLGDHNDYHVQQLMLEELVESGKWSPKTASACGFLTAVLADKQAAEREKALRLIMSFMDYKPLFGELFK